MWSDLLNGCARLVATELLFFNEKTAYEVTR